MPPHLNWLPPGTHLALLGQDAVWYSLAVGQVVDGRAAVPPPERGHWPAGGRNPEPLDTMNGHAMDNRQIQPAVEPDYEDPPANEQKKANFGITGMIALIAVIFVVVIVVAIVTM